MVLGLGGLGLRASGSGCQILGVSGLEWAARFKVQGLGLIGLSV